MALRKSNVTSVRTDASIRLLVAACGSSLLAFPARWVRGILTPDEAGSSETIASAGSSYTRIDLAGRLGLPAPRPSTDTRVILYGSGEARRAFTVDQVYELIDVERRSVYPLPAQFRRQERRKVPGYVFYQDTIALLINPAWLLEAESCRDEAVVDWSMSVGTEAALVSAPLRMVANQASLEP